MEKMVRGAEGEEEWHEIRDGKVGSEVEERESGDKLKVGKRWEEGGVI